MNCRNVLHLLSAYMDGELRGVEHRLVHDHLSCCRECEAEYQELLTTKRLLGRMRLQMPREELSEMILQRVAAEENRLAQRKIASGWMRFSQMLREALPNPRMMLSGAGMGIATALILAYTIVPENEDRIEWVPAATAQTSLLPSAPIATSPFDVPADSPLFRNDPAATGTMMDAPPVFVSRPGYTPVHNMSAYAPPSYEGVDARRGWYRIH